MAREYTPIGPCFRLPLTPLGCGGEGDPPDPTGSLQPDGSQQDQAITLLPIFFSGGPPGTSSSPGLSGTQLFGGPEEENPDPITGTLGGQTGVIPGSGLGPSETEPDPPITGTLGPREGPLPGFGFDPSDPFDPINPITGTLGPDGGVSSGDSLGYSFTFMM